MSKIAEVRLTLPEINHLLSLAHARDYDGWYYAPKEQFEKRHKRVVGKLEAAAEKTFSAAK